jgi:hypothetical protein
MRPYYEHAGITIYHGDARVILPLLTQPDTCIVDPVWPNSVFPGVDNPQQLFAEICSQLATERIVVHLGCTSDPRFLAAVPDRWPYLRTCWLRYARPSYRGRILVGSDVAYAYGLPPPSRDGRHVLSGEFVARNNSTKLQHTHRGEGTSDGIDYTDMPHPAPRRLEHLRWLVKTFVESGVIDPCCGTGTTLEVAKSARLSAIGIEIEERYCEIAAKRLRQEVFPFDDPRPCRNSSSARDERKPIEDSSAAQDG